MYENMTYEYLMDRLLEAVPADVSTAEGSIIYTALSPLAYELERAYIELDVVLKQTYATTADYDYLEKRAFERGLVPVPATFCQARGVFDVPIPIGSRFFIGDYNYTSGEQIIGSESGYEYVMVCETAGTGANGVLGELTLIEAGADGFDASDMHRAELTEILVAARDKESQADFLQRYKDSFNVLAFGGNVKDYMDKIKGIEGVGAVHIYPVWNGGGTIKAVILGNDHLPASSYLVQQVKEYMDPNDGLGGGQCPIGHTLTVASAVKKDISVTAQLTYSPGHSKATCEAAVVAAVEKYLAQLRNNWEDEFLVTGEGLTVRIAEVESRILNVEGVLDIKNTTLNSTSENVILLSEEVPILKEVSI